MTIAAYSHQPMYDRIKRIFDLAVAGLTLILVAPLLIVIAVIVRADSRGPLWYRGTRIGLYGRPFRILKFRTMIVGAESKGTTTALNDPRITRVGRFLRRYKLDELPQLFNVIRGEMSLVGPRPEVEEHTREYDADEQAILSVRPGVTDYSSIRFVNLDEVLGTDNAHEVYVTRIRTEKNRLRLEYVQKRGFFEDIRILMRTMRAIGSVVLRRIRSQAWNM